MKKSIAKTLLSVLLVAAVLVGGTLALLVATDSPAINTFKAAQVETNIVEPEGGNSSQKTPAIQNTGKSPVYVRAVFKTTDLPEGVTCTPNLNKTDWTDGSDGFYYYNKILQPGKTTTALFNGVTVNGAPKDPNASFSVDVYQESILAPTHNVPTDIVQAAKDAFAKKA